MPGQFYEDLVEGWQVAHAIRRTVTDTDNVLITTLTHNPQPLHLDAEYAAKTEFGRVVVNSIFTFGLMVGVSVGDTTLGTLVANLGFDAVKFPRPVFIGDTLRCESEVTDLRASKSRPNAGIATWEHRLWNQRDEIVCKGLRTALLLRAPAA